MANKRGNKKYIKNKKYNKYKSRKYQRMDKVSKRESNLKKFFYRFIVFVIFIIILLVCLISYNLVPKSVSKSVNDVIVKYVPIVENKEKKYSECLNSDLKEESYSDDINNNINELNTYLSVYDVSIIYKDLTFGYTYTFNESNSYYAASTIKTLDALYIYTKAEEGELSLDDTIVYTSTYNDSYSTGVRSHKLGDSISLRDLVSYAILYSDNAAHHMLVNYIGVDNFNNFAKEIGTSNIHISSGDRFGSMNINDATIIMSKLYEYFLNNTDNSKELKGYFFNANENFFAIDDLSVAHKYGHYGSYYHELGIVYDERPYILIVLTKNYNSWGEMRNLMASISGKVNDLHDSYYKNRENICRNKIYGE